METNRQVSIADIRPNPYQSRRTIDDDAVERLAREIRETGYWGGTLRVRPHNGHFELVFGHQRLRALKKLGHKTVAVEVVELTDIDMAEQSLIENLQRHNLPEMDKAEAIKRAFEMEKANNRSLVNDRAIIGRLALLLGYAHDQSVYQFLAMAGLGEETKKAARETNMPRGAVNVARAIGGEAMVKHAARERMSQLTLDPIRKIITPLPEPIRAAVVAAIIRDKLTTPEEVEKVTRREQAKTVKPREIPPDLMLFMRKWTGDLRVWTKRIKAAIKFKNYIHAHPEIATEFKNAAEEFIAALKELLDL